MERIVNPWLLLGASVLYGIGPEACLAQTLPPLTAAAFPPKASARPKPVRGEIVPTALVQPTPSLPSPSPADDPTAASLGDPDMPAPLPRSRPQPLSAAPLSPDGRVLNLKPPPLESTDLRFPINLATALRLSDARPLVVAAAQASAWVAEAQLTRAKVLWVPRLNIGADYIRHDGGGPDFNKGILTAPSVNFFYAGAGMWQNVAMTDAIFQPLAARQVLNSRRWDIQAAKNDALMQTAEAYFSVHQYRGMYAGTLYAVERGYDLVDRISRLSRDLVPRVEIDRAKNLLADLEQRATSAREEWRVRSADLTQVLRLDPRAVVEPLEEDHLQVTLFDPTRTLDDLIPIGLTNRPELASNQALVQATIARIRREKMRMVTPSLLINGFQTPYEQLQAGIFGIGPNSSLNQWTGRVDLSYQALWELEAFGIGNRAMIKEQRGEQSRQIVELFKVQDRVAADVTRAHARLQSAAARVGQAERGLRSAIISFNGNYEGLQQTTRFADVLVLVNRPQEAVFALQLLKLALDEYFTTVADYNRAQFQLFHALGYPAREVAYLRPPGEIQPVDTSRPGYLPPVGEGAPPATR